MSIYDKDDSELPVELTPEMEGYVELALDYARDRLSPEQAARFRELCATDEAFRRVVEPIVDSWLYPDPLPAGQSARAFQKVAAELGLSVSRGAVSEPKSTYAPISPERQAPEREERRNAATRRGEDAYWVSPTTGRKWRSRFSNWMPFHEYGFKTAAAMIVATMLAGGAGFGAVMLAVHAYQESAYVTRTIPAGELLLPLADSSVVQLEQSASLRYRKDLSRGTVRVVDLTGDARFDIVHYDGAADFVVRTPAVVLKAEQARLAVRARPDFTEIWVEEGTVWAQDRTASGDTTSDVPGRYLLPGTHVRISTSDHQTLRMSAGAAPFRSLLSPRQP